MPQAPNSIINAQFNYKPAYMNGFRISFECQHIDPYCMDAASTLEYEGYNLFNLRTGYRWESFEIWLNVMNTTDHLYATVTRANAWDRLTPRGNQGISTRE